jgi:phosphatidylinositol-3-phosphatase
MTASIDQAGPCEDCGAIRERGQRYCLECGARAGSRSAQLDELLRRTRARRAAERSELAGVAVADPSPAPAVPSAGSRAGGLGSRLSGLALPSSRVSAVLVLMFLAFGVIVGGVAGTPVQDTLAADAGRHVKLILPAAAPAATASSEASPSSSAPSEPPAAESEPTPSAASPATPPSSGTKPASGKSSSPSGSSGKGAENGGGGAGGSSTPAPSGSSSKLPPVKHVFVIMLSDQPYASVFGPSSPSPYLSQTLEHRGELLVRYYAVAHQQLANEIALISGQGPTVETAANCPTYSDIVPATVGSDEQVTGQGCVYPSSTQTLPGQLTAKHLTWRAYLEGMDEGAASGASGADGACGHPALGAADQTAAATPPAGQTYATWRNPFVYFHSLIDSSACASNDVGLSKLASDLSDPKNTPDFAYIAPDLCHDGSPTPCASGAPSGLGAAEGFLKRVVPEITGSKAYKENGLLAITVDEAPSSGEFADSSSCCGQPQFPNLPASSSALGPEGGGQVGALLLSPFIKQGVSQEPYNHFSLLRTIEDMFGLSHLGYAGLSKVSSFEPSIFSVRPSD